MNEIEIFKQTIMYEENLIWIKPLCDFFGLDVRNQHKKIKNDPILKKLVGKNKPDIGEIDKNGRILLTKKGFVRWIQIINPNLVKQNLKDKFIAYQELIFDYIFGSIEQKEVVAKKQLRLFKLKSLSNKIKNEIRKTEFEIEKFINKDFQYLLNL